jgi:hypothetical protein
MALREFTMATRWFFTRDGRQMHGPYTEGRISEMASTGQLLPNDKIRMDGSEKLVRAGMIKGLFAPTAGPEGIESS